MKARYAILLAAALAASSRVAPAQATSADYYGPQVIDVTDQGGAFPNPGQKGLTYTHDLATGAVSLRLAPWGVIKSARGPDIPYALVFAYSESLSYRDGTKPYIYFDWQVNGPPALGGAWGTLWAETTPAYNWNSAAFYGQEGG